MPSKGATRRALTPIALAALEVLHEGPRHPYEIHQVMQERQTGRLVKLTAGSLYHAIDRLAGDGLVETVQTTREGRRPERTVYRMTDAGRDAFAQRVRAITAEPATEFPQFALAIAILHNLDRKDALSQLRRRTMALEATIAAGRAVRERLLKRDLQPMYWIDVEYLLRMKEAELAFTEELLDRLTTNVIAWPTRPGTPCTDEETVG
jgi:DNA-binding PadR family transcriptional regulator